MSTPNDHDLLIAVDTKLEILLADWKEWKLKNVSRVEFDDLKQVAESSRADHEARLRKLERLGAMAAGALFLMQLAMKYLL